jgi:hypothetical protein
MKTLLRNEWPGLFDAVIQYDILKQGNIYTTLIFELAHVLRILCSEEPVIQFVRQPTTSIIDMIVNGTYQFTPANMHQLSILCPTIAAIIAEFLETTAYNRQIPLFFMNLLDSASKAAKQVLQDYHIGLPRQPTFQGVPDWVDRRFIYLIYMYLNITFISPR